MWIKNLKLYNFRNYLLKEFNFNNKKTIIIGNNGTGKTSLLEAIYLLCFGRSFRGKKDIHLINLDNTEAYINGDFYTETEKDINIIISLTPKKNIKINNKNIEKLSLLIGRINTILLSENDIDIIDQSPDLRRKFIDIIFSQIDHNYLINLIRYRKVLDERNFYLKTETQDIHLLDSYNKNLTAFGAEIMILRMKYLNDFFSLLKELILQYDAKALKKITSLYLNTGLNQENQESILSDKTTITNLFYNNLLKSYNKDKIYKFTTIGPHRDDILFLIDTVHRFSDYSSIGERRLLAILLKIAEANFIYRKKKDLPILLLDDILLELDKKNRELILKYITLSENQIFIAAANENEYDQLLGSDKISL